MASRRPWWLRILPLAVMAVGLSGAVGLFGAGCRSERPAYDVVRVMIPQLRPDEGSVTPVARISGRASQVLSFPNGDVALAEQYQQWFRANGWTRASHRQEVNSLEYIFTKDDIIMTIRFAAGRGVTIEGSRPAAKMEAPAAP
ncbi:MAG: hypothetical protein N2111_09065 [Candidatus Sumerlaeaceae bacterium]|nr:hypothetical protein [Candidatus Sumerlaeaceae bacterium]